MDLPNPFVFPSSIPTRRHGPFAYDNYRSYKDWLRDEFVFRCVYCLERETWHPSRQAAFAVEHIIPRVLRPDLICDYDNLAYACLRCNSLKQDALTLDSSRIALAEHLSFQPDGTVMGLTNDGREFILLFHLDQAPAAEVRIEKLIVRQLKRRYPDQPEVDQLYCETFGFPSDLSDLRAKRPAGNSRPEGVDACYFMRRHNGTLPGVY